ncbi:hypothetical protein E4U55_001997 [Claviceps digitariae]|nr:hypothetical protein E4U55_001997 [Claviceps digitariae]
MTDTEQARTGGVSELGGNTSEWFPPPPGPPPSHTQNQSQNPTQPESQPDTTQGQQQPHFPPPPNQHDENPSSSHLNHGQQTSSSIPAAYNPAAATVAAPAAQVGASDIHAQSTIDIHAQTTTDIHAQSTAPGQTQPALLEQSAVHPQHHAETKHEHKRSSWGGRIKSMLSANVGAPINNLAHKLGCQSFIPESLDKECDKAASILRDFCTKGVYAGPRSGQPPASTDPQAKESSSGLADPKNRVLVTIPPKVISKAVGLAIFTTFRAGFQVTTGSGSGVLIARLPDGSWSPPSGISVYTVGTGFQIGLDIYDCVCVINSREALSAFTNTRVSLGSDLAIVAGPYGAGGAVEFGATIQRGRRDSDKRPATEGQAASLQNNAYGAPGPEAQQADTLKPSSGGSKTRRSSRSASAFKPVFSYVKSRGFYAGIQVDGTVVVERKDANSRFYGSPVTVQQILQGQVPPQGPNNMWPAGARGLMETLIGAEAGALGHQPQQHQPQQMYAAQSAFGALEAGGAVPASSAYAGNLPAYSKIETGICPNGSHGYPPGSSSVDCRSGLGHQPFAGNASEAPPPYY